MMQRNKMLFVLAIFVFQSFFVSCSTSKNVQVGNSNLGSLYKTGEIENSILNNSLIADSDFDQDGITNSNDQCISVPETYNFYMDMDGCPDEFNYSDQNLEIKYVKIFNEENEKLTPNIINLIQMKFINIFTKYPNTFWIIEVRSPNKSMKKASSIKKYIDQAIKNNERTRILNSASDFEEIFLHIDSQKAKEIILKQIDDQK